VAELGRHIGADVSSGEKLMQIWVDADACPKVIKDILFRAAERLRIFLTLVANRSLQIPRSRYIRAIQVVAGFDVADHRIVQELQCGDLVITADIPLAAEIIEKGGHALDPRGEFYTKDNIGQRLALRNFMDELRGSGVDTGGPSSISQSDRHAFANQLDRFLAKHGDTQKTYPRPAS
jgi:uncharacterized protein YaiI (UPF0178 family)